MSQLSMTQRFAGLTKVLAAVVALLLVGSLLLALSQRDGRKYLTVDFPQTNSLYKGSDVKILGVPVGRVDELTPRGETVRVKLSYEGDVKLPDDVKALIVSPSIVGDRFVQLAPAYDGGAALKDNAFLPKSRTQVPVELDTVYQSLDDLSVALGPNGANKDGALSRLVDGTAGQLDGQGAQLNTTIRNFGKLSTTLANNKDELFGSIDQVGQFVKVLKANDATVRAFNDSTAEVSTVLAGEREDLAEALKQLSLALVEVNTLVSENKTELRENVRNLRSLTEVLGNRNDELEQITVNAPTALVNVALAYNPSTGTLDTRTALPELLFSGLQDPAGLLCNLLGETVNQGTGLCASLVGILDPITSNLPGGPELPGDLPLPRAAAGNQVSPQALTLEQMLGAS